MTFFRYITFARDSFNVGASMIAIGTANVLGLQNRNEYRKELAICEFLTRNKSISPISSVKSIMNTFKYRELARYVY